MPRTLPRLALVTMLAVGTGVATEATAALASSHRSHSLTAPATKKKPTVKIATTALGKVVVGANGHTLYQFDPNGTDTSTDHCTGGCASAWPPLKAKKPKAGKGISAPMLTVGVNGEVAYNGYLLHFYAGDTKAGDTSGNGIGGVWHAIGSDGNPLG